jgi:pimeloyl-ACP methyl ester carboxylesterase
LAGNCLHPLSAAATGRDIVSADTETVEPRRHLLRSYVRSGATRVPLAPQRRETAAMDDRDFQLRSIDGTMLSVSVEGSGPPLVLVHGTAASKNAWMLVAPLLAEHHTVWSYDRRGRGQSGDATTYDYALEVEDVRAVVRAVGDRVHLFGHSFGAYCALDASPSDIGVRSLTLYEIPAHQHRRDDAVQRALAYLDRGDSEAALVLFLRDVVGVSDDEVALLRSVPGVWNEIVATAPSVRREAAVLAGRAWDTSNYRVLDMPALYISGALTASPVYVTHQELAEVLPRAANAVLAGQRHIAMATDPQLLARVILDFVANADRRYAQSS